MPMQLLCTDETNLPSDPAAKFFVYGGLVLPADSLFDLHTRVAGIRKQFGYEPTDTLKFSTASRPPQVTVPEATAAKQQVVNACIDLGCVFIANVVLHAIAKNTSQDELIRRGANHVIGRFNRYCYELDEYGICLIDRLPGGLEYRYLSDKFTRGLDFEDGSTVALGRVVLFAATCNNASNLSSAVDIVLGSFRYCINQPKNIEAARTMMAGVTKMVWHKRIGDVLHVGERGLILRPKTIRVAEYRAEYDALVSHINDLLDDEEGGTA